MACQTFFFFFFFQEKQATENGILQIYKHGENCQNALRTAWLCEDLTVLLLQPGSVSLPSEMFGFLLSHLLRPPGCCLSQIGQCAGTQLPHHCPSPSGQLSEEPFFTEPAGSGVVSCGDAQ